MTEINRDIVDELLKQWAEERPGIDVSPLGIVVRIQMLAKLLQQRTTRALKAHGLKHWEYDVLTVLRRQGQPFEMPATEIADQALLSSGAMTTRIDGLEERGFVTRRRSETDRRSMLVRLTGKGLAVVDDAIESRISDSEEVLAGITQRNREALSAALRKLMLASS